MTTSGVTDFTMSRNDIINEAALKINAISDGVTMGGTQLLRWARNLNMLVKVYQADGLRVWKQADNTLFLVPGQIRYAVGSGATDHCCDTNALSTTAVTNSTPISSTLIPVDNTTGFVIGYKIGLVLDGGSIFWTTVAGFTSTTVTLTLPLTDSVTAGNPVFCYQSDIAMPDEVFNPRRYTISSGNEVPMVQISRIDYNNLQAKTSPGSATEMFYDKQRVTGYFNVWQVPATTIQTVRFASQKPLEIFTGAADNPDFPAEWCMTLVYNLAVVMIPNYAVSPKKAAEVTGLAQYFLDISRGHDREQTSVQFVPDYGP